VTILTVLPVRPFPNDIIQALTIQTTAIQVLHIVILILVEYLDFAQLSLDKTSFLTIPAKHTDEYTVGFWLLAKHPTTTSQALFQLRFDYIMAIYVSLNNSRCFINLDQSFVNQMPSETELSYFEINNSYRMTKISPTGGFNSKWIYYTCTLSVKANFFSLMYEDSLKNNKTKNYKNDFYYNNYEIDTFFPRYNNQDTFSIVTLVSKELAYPNYFVYLKHLAIFSEVISPYSDVHF
jgi:hypothetical protein